MNINKRKNAFTLIELIAVLVIMAIIALIATPLVMNIIRKARISADKRSIDAYGRSIELAIAGYLLDTGKFPTSVEQLTIEYSGNKVECSITQINTDSSVYLAGCTVAGRNVENYTYGEDKTPQAPTYTAYQVGDQVKYNEEITTYSAGTGAQTNGNGGMRYHSSSSAYEGSYVKTTVDAWKTAKAPMATEARLITIDDLKDNLGYELDNSATTEIYISSEQTPSWVYNSNYWYWTMSQYQDSSSNVWDVGYIGDLGSTSVGSSSGVVRPVITISKSNLSS